ncbi:hypothetical protein GCM10010254_24770 [Streptomyces chromofuscus]|nr:hypothetical protein GCM10010254_24770 [Streptomyces chromofuscus]
MLCPSPTQALSAVLDALCVPRGRAEPGYSDRCVPHASAGRRRLLLLDLNDARDCVRVCPLLPAANGCLAIFTSRRRLKARPSSTTSGTSH